MYFSGRVHTVKFHNPENAYYVLRMVLDDTSDPMTPTVTVAGNVGGSELQAGSWFGLEGVWVVHPQFGRQINITHAPVYKQVVDAETTSKMLIGYGVGTRLVQDLVSHFGAGLPEALRDEAALQQCSAVDASTASYLKKKWQTIIAYQQAVGFLQKMDVPQAKIASIWKRFGDDAEVILSENPWALVELPGFTWAYCEELAGRLKIPRSGLPRLQAAVMTVCESQGGFGHLYMANEELVRGISVLTGESDVKEIVKAVKAATAAKQVVVEKVLGQGVAYTPWAHFTESESAKLLAERVKGWKSPRTTEIRQAYEDALLDSLGDKTSSVGSPLREIAKNALEEWASSSKITLSTDQLGGALNALVEPVSILTGLPGTGKTQTVRSIVQILREAQVNCLLLAPTGIAAKRVSQLTGSSAYTIHRAFGAKHPGGKNERESGYDGILGDSTQNDEDASKSQQWKHGKHDPHSADVVVVDEASMIDQALLYRILECTKPTARLIFVGDHAQLPSVGPGHVLREMLTSGCFPTTYLTEIYRQANTSYIVEASHAVHKGEMPLTNVRDFQLTEVEDDTTAQQVCLGLATKLSTDDEDFQVISPRHGGPVGVTILNQQLRELLNPEMPGRKEHKLGQYTIREGDKVMVVRNDYDLGSDGIFNGDVGSVYKIRTDAKEVVLELPGPPTTHVDMPFSKVREFLRLCYVSTIHKNQGREVDVVVLLLSKSFGRQLQRNLLYTAITRAKKRVYIIGQHAALWSAIENSREEERNTFLAQRIRMELGVTGE